MPRFCGKEMSALLLSIFTSSFVEDCALTEGSESILQGLETDHLSKPILKIFHQIRDAFDKFIAINHASS